MTDYYAEIVVIERHIVQFSADSEEAAFVMLREGADEVFTATIVDHDHRTVLIETLDVNEDGPVWYVNSPFGTDTRWARELGRTLSILGKMPYHEFEPQENLPGYCSYPWGDEGVCRLRPDHPWHDAYRRVRS